MSLRERLQKYLYRHEGEWISGGKLEELAMGVGYKASNASRRLRELANEGKIARKEVKGFVWYCYTAPILPPIQGRLMSGERVINLDD